MFQSRLAREKWDELHAAMQAAPTRIGCQESDPDAWFPEEENGKGHKYREAKKICNACPVQSLCLEFALVNYEAHGLWGGLTPKDRQRLRGAPRGRVPNTR